MFENNIVADSTMGHVFQLTPYLEPAANMVFRLNIFANLTTGGANLGCVIRGGVRPGNKLQ